jgi:broad specificity polyphosphatase/5'/3'-nucleotidase SurE
MLLNLGGSVLSHGGEKETDFYWYDKGYTVITPLTIDATDYKKLKLHIPG